MYDDARPLLDVLGTGPDDDPSGPPAEYLLAEADTVFTFGHGPESVALFYAEAWRVEPVPARDAVARIAAWAAGSPAGRAVLVADGDPAADVALGAVLDGLGRAVPALAVRAPAGARVTRPHGSPLPG
ncbi:hypothetical protein WIS52_28405 [Pseudonocardia nematodicida]|uniref:Uncharacterized protein n=1 Tax=Pseudonocardia nematodicida TaxID=1206997 RepID=A0ABV1KL57_9PSEU